MVNVVDTFVVNVVDTLLLELNQQDAHGFSRQNGLVADRLEDYRSEELIVTHTNITSHSTHIAL